MSFQHALEHPTQAGAYLGEIPISHRYTAGVAGEKFLRELMKGKLFGSHCPKCDYTYFPARMYCERYMGQLKETDWVEVGPSGELLSFSAVHLDLDDQRLARPVWIGLVKLDGASGVFVHTLKPGQFKAGMRVKVVFKPESERVGSIKDIRWFEAE